MKKVYLFCLLAFCLTTFSQICIDLPPLPEGTAVDTILVNNEMLILTTVDYGTERMGVEVYNTSDLHHISRDFSFGLSLDFADYTLISDAFVTLDYDTRNNVKIYRGDHFSEDTTIHYGFTEMSHIIGAKSEVSLNNILMVDSSMTVARYIMPEIGYFDELEPRTYPEIIKVKSTETSFALFHDTSISFIRDDGLLWETDSEGYLPIGSYFDGSFDGNSSEILYVLRDESINIYDREYFYSLYLWHMRYNSILSVPFTHDFTRIDCVGDYLVLMNDTECDIYTKPTLTSDMDFVCSLDPIAQADFIDFYDNSLYYCYKDCAIGIIDFSSPNFLLEASKTIMTTCHITNTRAIDNNVIVSDSKDWVYSFDFTDPENYMIQDIIKRPGMNDFDVWENHVIISSDSVLYHYELNEDGDFIFIETLTNVYEQAAFNDDGIFVSSIDDFCIDFMQFDADDNIEIISTFSMDDNITDLNITEDKLTTLIDDTLIQIFDISDISSPSLLGEYSQNPIHKIGLIGNYVFALDTTLFSYAGYSRREGMSIIDFTDMSSPVQILDSQDDTDFIIFGNRAIIVESSLMSVYPSGTNSLLEFNSITGTIDTLFSSNPNYRMERFCIVNDGIAGRYYENGRYLNYFHNELYYDNFDDILVEPTSIELYSGWNAIAFPFASSTVVNAFRETPVISSYEYVNTSGSYIAPEQLNAGTGYWVLFDETPSEPSIVGRNPVDSLNISLYEGWNFIGSIINPVDIASFMDSTDIVPPIYWYNSATRAYELADTLFPYKAYWIFSTDSCEINLR